MSGVPNQALSELQEGISCVFQAFALIDSDADGKSY